MATINNANDNAQLEAEQLIRQELTKENPDIAGLFAIEEDRQALAASIKRRLEGIETSDYLLGFVFVIGGLAIFFVGVWIYWNLHGGDITTFAFWDEGDQKWLEVIFWSFFTAILRSVNSAAWSIKGQKLQKRDILFDTGMIFEGPIVAFSLILVITNLGLSFGDTTISLSDVPITIIIGLSVVFTYFAQDSVDALGHVSRWFKEQVESRLPLEDNKNRDLYDEGFDFALGEELDLETDESYGANDE